MKKQQTSWEIASDWYDDIVGNKGHDYHQEVVIPALVKLMKLKKTSALLDLGCGQGILERSIPSNVSYTGVDLSKSLIDSAKKRCKTKTHSFLIKDVCTPFDLKKSYTHCSIVLALQNMQDPLTVLDNASYHLEKDGKIYLVLNHPCFRIPRQSSWGIDPDKKIQFRRVDRYLSPLEIPITVNPSKNKSADLISFHFSLSSLSDWLYKSGFLIEQMQEWCSTKTSNGKNAKMENRSRKEFPLFLTIVGVKK